jgi:hypothetical protein
MDIQTLNPFTERVEKTYDEFCMLQSIVGINSYFTREF